MTALRWPAMVSPVSVRDTMVLLAFSILMIPMDIRAYSLSDMLAPREMVL